MTARASPRAPATRRARRGARCAAHGRRRRRRARGGGGGRRAAAIFGRRATADRPNLFLERRPRRAPERTRTRPSAFAGRRLPRARPLAPGRRARPERERRRRARRGRRARAQPRPPCGIVCLSQKHRAARRALCARAPARPSRARAPARGPRTARARRGPGAGIVFARALVRSAPRSLDGGARGHRRALLPRGHAREAAPRRAGRVAARARDNDLRDDRGMASTSPTCGTSCRDARQEPRGYYQGGRADAASAPAECVLAPRRGRSGMTEPPPPPRPSLFAARVRARVPRGRREPRAASSRAPSAARAAAERRGGAKAGELAARGMVNYCVERDSCRRARRALRGRARRRARAARPCRARALRHLRWRPRRAARARPPTTRPRSSTSSERRDARERPGAKSDHTFDHRKSIRSTIFHSATVRSSISTSAMASALTAVPVARAGHRRRMSATRLWLTRGEPIQS